MVKVSVTLPENVSSEVVDRIRVNVESGIGVHNFTIERGTFLEGLRRTDREVILTFTTHH